MSVQYSTVTSIEHTIQCKVLDSPHRIDAEAHWISQDGVVDNGAEK